MAEVKNIKDLKQTDSITAGDYVLIETSSGTNLIDFENFIIDEDNTTFAADLQTDVVELQTAVESVTAAVDVTIDGSAMQTLSSGYTNADIIQQDELYGENRIGAAVVFYHVLSNEIADPTVIAPAHPPLDDGTSKFTKYGGVQYDSFTPSSTLQSLSAKILQESFAFVKTLSAEIFGAGEPASGNRHFAEQTGVEGNIVFTGDASFSNWTPENNPGGILKAMLDGQSALLNNTLVQTKIQQISPGDRAASFTFGTTTEQLTAFDVDQSSVSFTQFFGEVSNSVPEPGSWDIHAGSSHDGEVANAYSNPNALVVTNYSRDLDGDSTYVGTQTWSVRLVGGTAPDEGHPVTVFARLVAKRSGS